MFIVAAVVAFAIALILWLASVDQGTFLTWQAFTLIGLLCMAAHMATGWWPTRRGT